MFVIIEDIAANGTILHRWKYYVSERFNAEFFEYSRLERASSRHKFRETGYFTIRNGRYGQMKRENVPVLDDPKGRIMAVISEHLTVKS